MFAAKKTPSPVTGGYQIERSLRFNSADSAWLSRTTSVNPTSQTIMTWSGWVKYTGVGLGTRQMLFYVGAAAQTGNFWNAEITSDTIRSSINAGPANFQVTTPVYRDPSAWMHIVVRLDTTQATAANRIRIYVNGTQVTATTGTQPTQNTNIGTVSGSAQWIGGLNDGLYFNGYMTEIYYIDGQSLDPTSFGEENQITGVWIPKKYIGTYGNNGYYVNFSDNSAATSTTLGKDYSGNNNNFTPNNFSVSAGVGNDSVIDSPTQYDDGGNGRGNYCVLNRIDTLTTATLVNGNLQFTSATTGHNAIGSIGMSSGKWYWEAQTSAGTTQARATVYSTTAAAYYSFAANNTVYGFRFDADAGTLDVTSNGTNWSSVATGLTSGPYFPYFNNNGTTSKTVSVNFGQRSFSYTPPTGYKALNTFNLPTPTIVKPTDYFDTLLYTGTGSSRSVTGANFSPDLVWVKSRSGGTNNVLYDTTRGVEKQLVSNNENDEATQSTGLTSFDSNGFSVGSLTSLNTNAATYAAWVWKEGVLPGFEVVSYTGNGANRTISHNLGVAPNMMIIKARTTAGTNQGWPVYHSGSPTPTTTYLGLSQQAAATSSTTVWNSTAPTASVFSLGTDVRVNANDDTYIAYLWADVVGFSKFGSFTGNGVEAGPFVFCGFRPAFIMFKNASATSSWGIQDSTRNPQNVTNLRLYPDDSMAEQTQTSTGSPIDILSNGFRVRGTSAGINGTGNTIVFAAFAENPFKYAIAR